MAPRVIQTSFAAGELSPALYARVDLEKYSSGLALARNWFVDYRGGASTRPGTQFIGQCLATAAGQPRLIPFVFSTIAAYVLEFGDGYVRFVSGGAFIIDPGTSLPLIVTTPYAWQDLPLLKFAQSADVLTLTHPSYPIYNLTRTSPTSFALAQDVIGPKVGTPNAPGVVQRNGLANGYAYGYVVTALNASGEESSPSLPNFVDGDILNQNTGILNVISMTPVDTAVSYRVYKTGPTASGAGNTSTPVGTFFGFIGNTATTTFIDNNIAPDLSQTPPSFQDPFSPGQIAEVVGEAPGGGYTVPVFNLLFRGDGTGAEGYGIADKTSGLFAGAILTNPGKGYTTCTVSDSDANSTAYTVVLGQESGTYPACVGYFQQRRAFGGTNNFPESLVFSQPGQYDNFDTSAISEASDSITVSLASREVNAIKSITAMSTGLVVLTTGGGFLVSGGSTGAAFTPSSVSAFPQASSGCNDLPPLVVNYDLLYAQNRGAVVRDLAFNFYVQSYTGTDRSVLASHLFTGHTLLEWTYAEEPFRQIPLIREDGVLLNFTYVPEQEIFAWTHSDTDGYFRSVTSIPEGQTNSIYVIVQRLVNGAYVYYIERFASGIVTTAEDAWCLDCALALPANFPAANMAIGDNGGGTGLPGQTIGVLAEPGIFTSGSVGQTIWAGGGQALVSTYIDSSHVTATIVKPFPRFANDPTNTYLPYLEGTWQLDPNVTVITGLSQLEGMQVTALADGTPVCGLTVFGGSVTLPYAASKVVVGLSYQCQLQTLKINLGDPTVQGSRKLITGITARVDNTLGLQVGQQFGKLTQMKELLPAVPPALKSLDAHTLTQSYWNKDGQICFQQDAPWPATILGIIPEVVRGDTGR